MTLKEFKPRHYLVHSTVSDNDVYKAHLDAIVLLQNVREDPMPPVNVSIRFTYILQDWEEYMFDWPQAPPGIKMYKRLRRIHLRQSLKARRARVKLFVLSGRKIIDLAN